MLRSRPWSYQEQFPEDAFASICPRCKARADHVVTCGICGLGEINYTYALLNADVCPRCGTTAMQMLKQGGCRCTRRVREFPSAHDFNMMTAWENL